MNPIANGLAKLNYGHKTALYLRGQKVWIRYGRGVRKPLKDAPILDEHGSYRHGELERLMAAIGQCRDKWDAEYFGGELLEKMEEKEKPHTLQDVIDEWSKSFSVPATMKNNKSYMKKVTTILGKSKELERISRRDIEIVAVKLAKTDLMQNTQRYVLKKFRGVLLYAHERGFLHDVPSFKDLIPREIVQPRSFLTIDQINAVANTEFAHPDVKYCFLFACYSGCRIGEARHLTWDDVSLEQCTWARWQSKTKTFVHVPLTEKAFDILHNRTQEQGKKIFGIPVDQVFNRQFRHLLEQAGIYNDALKARHCRVSFSKLLINHGVRAEMAKELLGHQSIKTTLTYYNQFDLSDKRQAIHVIDKVFSNSPENKKNNAL